MGAIADALDRLGRRVHPAVGGAVLVAAIAGGLILLLTSGGDDPPKVPANSVALVGSAPISNTDFRHWQTVYTKSSSGSGGTKPTAAQARTAAFELLAGFAWIEQEAARQHVTVPNSKVDTAINQLFTQYKGYTKAQILQALGSSEVDLRRQQRVALLASALQSKVAKTAPAPTASQINAAYTKDAVRWAHPSQRDVRVVLATSQKDAAAAAAALKSGSTFSAVNKKYSSSTQLSTAGGALKALKPGANEATFERAVFSAPLGQLIGPIKVANGWLVFKVQRITKLPDKTLQASTAAIRAELTATAQGKLVSKYLKDLRTYWRAHTTCVAAVKASQYCKA
jgi:parvulin-like peptidyl-prolyl isomerase